MDDLTNRLAKELADAIAAAVAESPAVAVSRLHAREAGFDLRVSLEAIVGFVQRADGPGLAEVTAPARIVTTAPATEFTTNDRRFLKSLRIGLPPQALP
jgi:hypothetical protein